MSKLKGGAGSIYQRGDGMWCGAVEFGRVDGKRNRKVITSKNRETVEARILELVADRAPVKTRKEHMADARLIATHTPNEWYAKVRASAKTCRYCDTNLSIFNTVKDHMIAVETGGSDGIDNVQPICWECNNEKRTQHHDEYAYAGEKPRPFSVMPIRRAEYERAQAFQASRKFKL